MIYFIQDESGCIKIGHSTAPLARFSQLQTGSSSKLTMLALEDGGAEREAELHVQFRHLHVSGEWFLNSADLVDYVSTLTPYERPVRAVPALRGSSLNTVEMAKALGVTRPYVSLMRNGQRPISLEIALSLYAFNGDKIGPLQNARGPEIQTLLKFITLSEPFFESPRHVADLEVCAA